MIFNHLHRSMLLLILLVLASSLVQAAGPSKPHARPGELIVAYRPGVISGALDSPGRPQTQSVRTQAAPLRLSASAFAAQCRPESLKQLQARYGLREGRALGVRTAATANPAAPEDLWLLKFDAAADVAALTRDFKSDPNVLYAEPNYEGSLAYVPSDPLYGQTQADLGLIGIEAAWDTQRGANASVIVAVIDSGIDATHPELAPAVDLANSYNFVESNSRVYDDLGHGTRIAGIIGAAGNNGAGIAGVAFGCRLLSLDVSNGSGVLTVADVVSAINWAVAHGAKVINLSLCFSADAQSLREACAAASSAGALLVAAAGNENQGDLAVYPASYDSVLGVGAVLTDGQTRAPWSNYDGAVKKLVDLVAPGETVFSTIPGGQYNGTSGSGTSFAAPLASGVAALLKAKNPLQSGRALRQHLLKTAQPLASFKPTGGAEAGRLSAKAALQTPMLPDFEVASVRVDDAKSYSAANDANGAWDKGEKVQLIVSLKNNGADATAASATLSTTDTQATLGDTAGAWGALRNGETTLPKDGFTTITMAATAVAHEANFTLHLSVQYASGAPAVVQTLRFKVAVENSYTPPTIIGANTTWSADKTYRIKAPTVVMDSAKLTIQPGTTLHFDPAGKLEVRGAIDAQRTAEHEITWTSIKDQPAGNFEPSVSLPVGDNPHFVAIGDADNDGHNDIVTANYNSNTVSLLHWNGVGFDPQVTLAVGIHPSSVAIGDADNDGYNDIVTANDSFDGTVSLLHWNGKGFDSPITLAVGHSPNCVVIGDADNDGHNDIVTANMNSNTVSLLRWKGKGFDPLVNLSVGVQPWSVAIGDADNDGKNDIVTANHGSGNVSLLRWNGNGFAPQVTLAVEEWPNSVTIGDADNDGKNDIVTCNGGSNYYSGSVSLLRWNGTGFDPQVTMKVGVIASYPYSVVIGDADNDGDNDIVTANYGSNNVSLFRWNGMGFDPEVTLNVGVGKPRSVAIGDADSNGSNDLMTATNNYGLSNVSLLHWNDEIVSRWAYGGLWLRSSATQVQLAHCRFKFAPVLDESGVASLSDCLFDRSGGDYSFSSTGSGTNPLTRCRVTGNAAGDGIRAGTRPLTDCVAENNKGTGLKGGVLSGCQAISNGSTGMSGASAKDCLAQGNTHDGIFVSGTASGCTARYNGDWGVKAGTDVTSSSVSFSGGGIAGRNITGSLAQGSRTTGILSSGTTTHCLALNNGGVGIQGNDFTDCAIADNGSGLSLSGTALRCYVAGNGGDGVTGGTVRSSVVLSHPGNGVSGAALIEKSAVVGNGRTGIKGKTGAPYTAVSGSLIMSNSGAGVTNAGPVSGCILSGNGGATGYDYQETRPSTELLQTDLSGNYWGPATTALMQDNPWGTYFDIPKIYDFVDKTSLTEVKYANNLAAAPSAVPDASAPAFLLSITPNLLEPANVGLTTFTLTFSKPMNRNVNPSVTFDLAAPYTAHVVEASRGWTSATTWKGVFSVSSTTGDGLNALRVAGATDAGGGVIPNDSLHQFLIDTSGHLGANNGLAIIQGTKVRLEWSESGKPAGALGYNVLRSASGQPGSYSLVNPSTLGSPAFQDTGLAPQTTYYYIVYIVDGQHNASQWIAPLVAKTGDYQAAVQDWAAYR